MIRVILGLLLIFAALCVFAVELTSVTANVAGFSLNNSGLHLSAASAGSGNNAGAQAPSPNGKLQISTSTTAALLALSNLAPGDAVTAPLTVRNDGTLDLRFAVTALATNDDGKGLANQLQLTIKSGVSICTNAGYKADGVTLYGPAPLGSVAGLHVIGDPGMGNQPGDRLLRVGASETLCFSVILPLNTPNAFAGTTTTATINFISESLTP